MDPLAHARDIAALDRPATEWEYSRATLAVLLAILDGKPTGLHALLAAGPTVRVDYHRHGTHFLYRGRVQRVGQHDVAVEVIEDLGSTHRYEDVDFNPHVKVGRTLTCPIEHLAIEVAQAPPQQQPAQTGSKGGRR